MGRKTKITPKWYFLRFVTKNKKKAFAAMLTPPQFMDFLYEIGTLQQLKPVSEDDIGIAEIMVDDAFENVGIHERKPEKPVYFKKP